MRRVMSIWFPELPLDLRVRMGDPRVDDCFAIIQENKNAWRLTHLSNTAKRQGLQPQMSVTDARAIAPHLLTEKRDTERENLLLRSLWRWSDTFTPWGALDTPDGLFLDITGCAHLFGGEAKMSDHVLERLGAIKIKARIAVCDTKRGAWALARFTNNTLTIAPPGEIRTYLDKLPVGALNLKSQTSRDLKRAGLKTIGALYELKSAALARRFGLELTDCLSRALGHAPDPVSPQAADPIYSARMTLPEPIGFLDDLNEVLGRLSKSVCDRMKAAHVGARRFDLTVRCVDTGDHSLSVGFAKPCLEPNQLLQQFAKPLDDLKIEFGADWFRLVAKHLEPLKFHQLRIDNDHSRQDEDVAQTLSTIGNRLGFDRVLRLIPNDSHVPEYEYRHVEAVQKGGQDWPEKSRLRPERLFSKPQRIHTIDAGRPPKRFQWRKIIFKTVEAEGPERLLPHWWETGDKRTRDYWITTTETGQRLWLLTYPSSEYPEWYIAGRFA